MKTKKGMSASKKVAIGGAMAAIGAGAYYLLGPDAETHQKKASVLMGKIKKEVEVDAKKLKSEWKEISKKAVKKYVSKKKKI